MNTKCINTESCSEEADIHRFEKGGDIYEGVQIKDIGVWNGRITYANGNIYEGSWNDCGPHGKGIMKREKAGWQVGMKGERYSTYSGIWENGHENGEFVIKWDDNSSYHGTCFRNSEGILGGKGKCYYSKADKYRNGHWKGDEFENLWGGTNYFAALLIWVGILYIVCSYNTIQGWLAGLTIILFGKWIFPEMVVTHKKKHNSDNDFTEYFKNTINYYSGNIVIRTHISYVERRKK